MGRERRFYFIFARTIPK